MRRQAVGSLTAAADVARPASSEARADDCGVSLNSRVTSAGLLHIAGDFTGRSELLITAGGDVVEIRRYRQWWPAERRMALTASW